MVMEVEVVVVVIAIVSDVCTYICTAVQFVR